MAFLGKETGTPKKWKIKESLSEFSLSCLESDERCPLENVIYELEISAAFHQLWGACFFTWEGGNDSVKKIPSNNILGM